MKLSDDTFKTIVEEAAGNLLEFLTRDQPRRMGLDLLIRGHQIVGLFLLRDFSQELPSSFKEKFESELDKSQLNLWSLKVLNHWEINRPTGQYTTFKPFKCPIKSKLLNSKYLYSSGGTGSPSTTAKSHHFQNH